MTLEDAIKHPPSTMKWMGKPRINLFCPVCGTFIPDVPREPDGKVYVPESAVLESLPCRCSKDNRKAVWYDVDGNQLGCT